MFEHVDWAEPMLEQPLQVERSQAVVSDRPGTGQRWNEDVVRRFLVAWAQRRRVAAIRAGGASPSFGG